MPLMVFCTVPRDKAKSLSELLLKEKVCACVNIIKDVDSFFWWEGKIDSGQEALLVIKTTDQIFSKLEKLIKDNHPYEVPEIIGFSAAKINKEYLDWLKCSVGEE